MWLPTPGQSLFTTNLGLNRQIGLMVWGLLFEKCLDCAVGSFNGLRYSLQRPSNGKDFIAYLNRHVLAAMPALVRSESILSGGSVARAGAVGVIVC